MVVGDSYSDFVLALPRDQRHAAGEAEGTKQPVDDQNTGNTHLENDDPCENGVSGLENYSMESRPTMKQQNEPAIAMTS